MKNEVQIYHNLGLGDHIICNGLVRELCKTYKKVYCFVKEHNFNSVFFMYRDESKIELITVKNDWEVQFKIKKNIELIKIRVDFRSLNYLKHSFDEIFYNQLGYEFSLRWDNFYFERDYETEKELYYKLDICNSPYIFVHDDPTRGFSIDLKKVSKNVKLFKSSDFHTLGNTNEFYKNYTLFHWILVLENAREIHCFDSSFKCLIDSIPNINNNLFFHTYVKGYRPYTMSSTRKDWTIIKSSSLSFKVKNLRFFAKFEASV